MNLQTIIDALVALLPAKLQPVAKAVAPLVVASVTAAITWVATGKFNATEIITLIVGGTSAVAVHKATNTPVHADIEELS